MHHRARSIGALGVVLLVLAALAACGDDGGAGNDAGPDASPSARYGGACADHGECEGGFCVDEEVDPSFVGGYCSELFCDPFDADSCAPDGACFNADGYPEVCARRCAADAECRAPDYVCIGVCAPSLFAQPLARPGVLTGGEADLAALVAALDDARMMERVRILAGEQAWAGPGGDVTIASRAVAHPDHAHALDWLEAAFTALGLSATRLPFFEGHVSGVNLEAEVPGTDAGAPPVLVTAHWDSIASSTSGWNAATDPAPGAGDNASGVTFVLELAWALTQAGLAAPPVPVRFVLFDAEEDGLLGSAAYAADLANAGAEIACVLNVDMIHGTTAATAGRVWFQLDETSRPLAALGAEAVDLHVSAARLITTDYPAQGSDHASFWDEGYCAVGMSSYPRLLSNHTADDDSSTFQPVEFATNARAAAAVAAAWIHHGR